MIKNRVRQIIRLVVGCYLVGVFFLSPSWWVRGVIIGLLIFVVIRYMSSRKSNGEDAEDKEDKEDKEEW